MKDNKQLFWLLSIFSVFSLFFINKAYHIDDPFTITIAKAIGEHCIRVPQTYQGSLIFMDDVCDNPLFLGYYYAPIIKLFQDKEFWMHLFYLPFSWLAIISMYFLSRRFISKGIFTTLCFCVTPVFIVMSQNIMLDIPLLAFFLAALAAFIYGTDRDNKKLIFLSTVLAGLAILTKYSGLLVILIMFTYALIKSKKHYVFFLLIPISMLCLWCLHNYIFYRQIYFLVGLLMKGPAFSLDAVILRTFAVLSFLSGTSICTIFLIFYLLRAKVNRWLCVLSLPVGMLPFFTQSFSRGFNIYLEKGFNNYGYANLEKMMLGFFFACSFFIILLIFKSGAISLSKKYFDSDNLFLSLWFIYLLVFTILIQFVAARFVLLLFPPMFLLISKELSLHKLSNPLRLTYRLMQPMILVTFILSAVLAVGDYRLAGLYRDFAVSLKKRIAHNNQPVYFCGDSFDTNLCYGYAYYLRRYFPQAMDIKLKVGANVTGDFIYIHPVGSFLSPVFYEKCLNYSEGIISNQKLVETVSYRGRIFIHNRNFRTGFYSHDWGLLPFYISINEFPLEAFEIYQVTTLPESNLINYQ